MNHIIYRPLALAVVLYLISLPAPAHCANILFYSPIGSYSHKIAMWPLVESLASRGHQITFISPFKDTPSSSSTPHPNITDYNPKQFTTYFSQADEEWAKTIFDGRVNLYTKIGDWALMFSMAIEVCQLQLKDPTFMDWLRASQFDLAIIDDLFNDCGYGLAAHFKAATIVYSTSTLYPWSTEQFGLQIESSWIPDTIFPGPGPGDSVSFVRRIWGTLHPLVWYYGRKWFYMHHLDALFAETLGNIPPIEEVEQETSLMFINSHYATDYARPLPPFVVPVGGTQCDKNGKGDTELTNEIASFVDRDFVYISFGSFADMYYHPRLLEIFTNAFRSLSHLKFVLKTKGAGELEFPENVLALKWVPQQQLLQHPKIRAFISHTGLLGTHEAICAGVPLISMPVFAEQDFNAGRIHQNKYGIRLEVMTVTTEELVQAITNVTTDPTYTVNIKTAGRLFADQPTSGTVTATWWVEYVLRHRHGNELSALKPLSMKQTWYERRLLDVWAFIFAAVMLAIFTVLFITKCVLRALLGMCGLCKCKSKSSTNVKVSTSTRKKTKTS